MSTSSIPLPKPVKSNIVFSNETLREAAPPMPQIVPPQVKAEQTAQPQIAHPQTQAQVVVPFEPIRIEMDRLAAEGFGFILARYRDAEVKGPDGKITYVGNWHCSCPTMRLNCIPQARHHDPVLCILECERELRKYLADKQWHHYNPGTP